MKGLKIYIQCRATVVARWLGGVGESVGVSVLPQVRHYARGRPSPADALQERRGESTQKKQGRKSYGE